MVTKQKEIVYWTLLEYKIWKLYIARRIYNTIGFAWNRIPANGLG